MKVQAITDTLLAAFYVARVYLTLNKKHTVTKTFLSRVPPSSTHAQQSLQHSKPLPSNNLDVAFGVTFRGEAVEKLRHTIAEGNGEVPHDTIRYRFVHSNSRYRVVYRDVDQIKYR
jgi:hypothetical protein